MKVNPQLCLFSSACPQIANHCLFYWNLLYSSFVASALKRSLEEFVHDLLCCLVIDKTSRHNEHVGVGVLTCEMSNLWHPCQSCAHTVVSVERDGKPLAAATDAYAGIYLTAGDAVGKLVGKIRIVAAHVAVCAVVRVRITM